MAIRIARLVLCAAVLMPLTVHAQRVVMGVGVGQAAWLSPNNWGQSLSADVRVGPSRRVSLTVGMDGLLGLSQPSVIVTGSGATQPGAAQRRDRLATLRVGPELRVARLGRATLHASAQLAGSYYWSEYDGLPAGTAARASGATWVRGVYGARLQLPAVGQWAVSARAAVQPRFDGARTWNPVLSLGIGF